MRSVSLFCCVAAVVNVVQRRPPQTPRRPGCRVDIKDIIHSATYRDMESSLSSTTSTTSSLDSLPTSPISDVDDNVPAHHVNSVVAFMIGFAIILLASILNAGGLNLTKLDHVRPAISMVIMVAFLTQFCRRQVRTSAIPKASRRKDWLRPLWLLGMILYMCVVRTS